MTTLSKVFLHLLAGATLSTTAAFASSFPSQFGFVEVSQVLPGGSGPSASSSQPVTETLDLSVGVTGLEAQVRTSDIFLPPTVAGETGQLFVQATSVFVPSSSAMGQYKYEFQLEAPSMLQFLRFTAQTEAGSMGQFSLTRNGIPLYESSGPEVIVTNEPLAAGDYHLTVLASASASDTVARDFIHSQVDFALFYVPATVAVPEPSGLSIGFIACLAAAVAWWGHRPRVA